MASSTEQFTRTSMCKGSMKDTDMYMTMQNRGRTRACCTAVEQALCAVRPTRVVLTLPPVHRLLLQESQRPAVWGRQSVCHSLKDLLEDYACRLSPRGALAPVLSDQVPTSKSRLNDECVGLHTNTKPSELCISRNKRHQTTGTKAHTHCFDAPRLW